MSNRLTQITGFKAKPLNAAYEAGASTAPNEVQTSLRRQIIGRRHDASMADGWELIINTKWYIILLIFF
ncbi:MAG: hypothetical protein LBK66_07185 [Spirochaetaceae bacterium]|nr:hypothetical protein [Spirochaetaceae bacterium]